MSGVPWWVDLAKVHVLVEDEVTWALLDGVWSDTALRVEPVGGEPAVRAMVNDARQRGSTNVFGVVDRDFEVSAAWSKSASVYRLERHEVENYLLDFDALAGLARADRAEVEAEAVRFARQIVPWMAARRALHEIDLGLTESFPALLAPNEQRPLTLDGAVALVCDRTFWSGLRKKLNENWTDTALRDLVRQHNNTYRGEVESGLWVSSFSGKEVVQHLRGTFAKLGTNNVDLAKRVAKRWRETKRIPGELGALSAELKRRVAVR